MSSSYPRGYYQHAESVVHMAQVDLAIDLKYHCKM